MSVIVRQVMELLEKIAPLSLAEEWDNPGLLCGSMEQPVERILCALDLTQGVLEEAKALGVQMIVTHHPILFRPRQNLRTDDSEGRLLYALVQSGIALTAMHTNYDNAHPGVNDALAERLELSGVRPLESGMCIGEIHPMTLQDFVRHVENRLGGPVRCYGDRSRIIRNVAVLGGAGEDFTQIALEGGADAYVTGEVSYHKGLSAVDDGLCVLEAGHAATENPAISQLCRALQSAANDVEYNICVFSSTQELFL